jgi:hypothetical protein
VCGLVWLSDVRTIGVWERTTLEGVACLLLLASASGSVAPALRLRGGMPIHSLSDLKRDDEAKGRLPPSAMAGPVDGEKLSKEFMGMYHEKQIGGLCAVHCMNNLVQGPVFDEIEVNDSFVTRIKCWQRTVPRMCWRGRADCSLGHCGGPASRAANFHVGCARPDSMGACPCSGFE